VDFIIKLNELEVEALKSIVCCPCEWTANAIHNRARIAIDDITGKYVAEALENGWNIPQTKLEIVKAYNEKHPLTLQHQVSPIL